MSPFIALVNGEKLHLEYPATFAIPPLEKRRKVKVGQYVKLGFIDLTDTGEPNTERMWVKVTGDGCGILSNTPATTKLLRHGERVSFEPENILDILEVP